MVKLTLDNLISQLYQKGTITGPLAVEVRGSSKSLLARIYLEGGRDESTELILGKAVLTDVSDNAIDPEWEWTVDENSPYKLIQAVKKATGL